MTDNASVSQFFTNSDLTAHISTLSVDDENQQISKIDDVDGFFEVAETVSWVKGGGFKRVALQFPDSFLAHADYISDRIEKECHAKVFILADTSYRSCCVDFVAAAHATCDALIHYGNACLSSPSTEIPVKFVLGRLHVDVPRSTETISALNSEALGTGTVVLVSDAPYGYCMHEVAASLQANYPTARFIECPVDLQTAMGGSAEDRVLGRRVPPELRESEGLTVVFIGSSSSLFLPIWLMTFPQITSVVSYDPKEDTARFESTTSVRQLRKRLFMVEKMKDANTVGLVVGTVGLDGHRDAVKRMRSLCKAAGKKMYVISVGKVNVPKLSNFSSDIDVFVLVSCPFGVLLDTSDFYTPVISLFEAEVALNPANSWAAGSGWTADFSKFLHDAIGEDGGESDLSLLTGKIRSRPAEEVEEGGEGTGQVAVYTAGDYFKQRSWRGLDDSVRVDEDTTVTEGRSGVASSYHCELDRP